MGRSGIYGGRFVSLSLTLNEGCNYGCSFCFWGRTLSSTGPLYREIKDEDFYNGMHRILPYMKRDVHGLPSFSVSYFATEPSLSMSKVRQYTPYLRQLGAREFSMTTNGYVLTDDDIRWMYDNKFHINLSFEGTKERQDRLRPLKGGMGTYYRVYSRLHYMRHIGISYNILMVVEPTMHHTIYDAVRSMIVDGPHYMYLNLDPSYTYEWTNSRLSELEESLSKVADMMLQYPQYMKYVGPYYRVIDRMLKGTQWTYFDYHDSGTCGAAKGSIALDIEGRPVICHKAVGDSDVFGIYDDSGNIDWSKVMEWRGRVSIMGASGLPYTSSCYLDNYWMTGDPDRIHQVYVEAYKAYYRGLLYPVIRRMIVDPYFLNRVIDILKIRVKGKRGGKLREYLSRYMDDRYISKHIDRHVPRVPRPVFNRPTGDS